MKYRLTIYTKQDKQQILLTREYKRLKHLQDDLGGISLKTVHEYLRKDPKGISRRYPIMQFISLSYTGSPSKDFKTKKPKTTSDE